MIIFAIIVFLYLGLFLRRPKSAASYKDSPTRTVSFIGFIVLWAWVTKALAEPGYDIVIVAGQSNSVCSGLGDFIDPGNRQELTSKIDQVSQDFKIVPTVGESTAAKHECLQDYGYHPDRAATGFGLAFAEQYAANQLASDRRVLVVPAGCGGTSILSWLGEWENPELPCAATPRNLPSRLLKKVQVGMAGPGAHKVVAFLWAQGETDLAFSINQKQPMSVDAYRIALWRWFYRVRKTWPGNYPIITTRLSPDWLKNVGIKQQFENAISDVCRSDVFCKTAYTGGLKANDDEVHLNAQSKILLGIMMYTLAYK